MRYAQEFIWKSAMKRWLGSKSFKNKIKMLERGKLMVCSKCGTKFFDREPIEERILKPCIEHFDRNHTCVEKGRYVILKRGFRQIIWWTEYSKAFPLKAAIVEFFKNQV